MLTLAVHVLSLIEDFLGFHVSCFFLSDVFYLCLLCLVNEHNNQLRCRYDVFFRKHAYLIEMSGGVSQLSSVSSNFFRKSTQALLIGTIFICL